jgi:Cupin domain
MAIRKDRRGERHGKGLLRRSTPPDYAQRDLMLTLRIGMIRRSDRVLMVDDWIETGAQATCPSPLAGAAERALPRRERAGSFLVLAGACTLIVEEQERSLRQWDYFHCPPNTRHIFVGAGDGPCAILMIGLRREVDTLRYPVSEVAAKYGVSVVTKTEEPDEAYADWPGEYVPTRLRGPLVSDTTP